MKKYNGGNYRFCIFRENKTLNQKRNQISSMMDEITSLDIISIKREAAKLIRVNTEIREGQAIYIAAQKMFPKAVDKLKHTKVDCFYEDSRIDSFLLELQN